MVFINNYIWQIYGMTETGLICQHPQSAITDLIAMGKEEAVSSKTLKNSFSGYFYRTDLICIYDYEEHVFGSVGRVAPFCKLKVMIFIT